MCLSWELVWKALLFFRFQLTKWKVQFLESVSSTTVERTICKINQSARFFTKVTNFVTQKREESH